jgi:toxin ParE1/3/4
MNLVHHPAVGAEVVAAAGFYEQRVPGLGTDFLDEFDRSITAIAAAPLTWRVAGGNKRRHLMKRFPYGIYYRVTLDEVRILVLKHHAQHPDYGSDRT